MSIIENIRQNLNPRVVNLDDEDEVYMAVSQILNQRWLEADTAEIRRQIEAECAAENR